MKSFHESDRYDYPLTPNSIVIDAGGYQGSFATEIARKYGCTVHILEPVTRFREAIIARGIHAGIHIHPYGLAGETKEAVFHIQGDSTGAFADSNDTECVVLHGIVSVLNELCPTRCDLLKLNIEGTEFDVLEAILSQNIATRITNIQVQFHAVVPNYMARYEAIRAGLLATHHLTYDAPWCWQNFQINA